MNESAEVNADLLTTSETDLIGTIKNDSALKKKRNILEFQET